MTWYPADLFTRLKIRVGLTEAGEIDGRTIFDDLSAVLGIFENTGEAPITSAERGARSTPGVAEKVLKFPSLDHPAFADTEQDTTF